MALCKVHFKGRLGNNLFQLASGYAYCKENGYTLCCDYVSPMPYNVYLNVSAPPNSTGRIYREPHYRYAPIPPGFTELSGFFQSSKYFSKYANEIRDLFAPTEDVRQYIITRYASHITAADTTIAIHARRGDFVNNPGHQVIQSNKYYEDAIQEIKKRTGHSEMRIFIVSDDIGWCREQAVFDGAYFLEETDPLISLYILSSFRHYVLSNSSFSWWAVFLSNTCGVVTCPSRWLNPSYITDDFDVYEPTWIKIACG